MIVGVLKEPSFETRVSLLAEGAVNLIKKRVEVWVESGAGVKAFCSDEDYIKAGGVIQAAEEIVSKADVLLSIHYNDLSAALQHKLLIGVYQPLYNYGLMQVWAKQNITSFSLDMLPRTTRA